MATNSNTSWVLHLYFALTGHYLMNGVIIGQMTPNCQRSMMYSHSSTHGVPDSICNQHLPIIRCPNKSSHNHQQQHKSSLQPKQERYRRAPVNAVSTVTSDHSSTSSECRCAACDGPCHSLTKCQTFLDMPFEKRRDIVNRHQMCLNCLYPGHKLQDCRSMGTCRTCKSNRHHTLLHQSESASQPAPPSTSATNKKEGPVLVTYGTEPGDDVILSTARVKITHAGQTAVRRALMDSGSVPSLITHKLTNQLGLDRIQHTATFTHAGGELITSRHKVSLMLHAIHELRKPQPITVSCHVVDSLTNLSHRTTSTPS